MNTEIKITFSDGTVNTFNVSDTIEEKLQDGGMISVATLHPKFGETVDKVYAGNPMSALGEMLIFRGILQKSMGDGTGHRAGMIDGVTKCVELMANEVSL